MIGPHQPAWLGPKWNQVIINRLAAAAAPPVADLLLGNISYALKTFKTFPLHSIATPCILELRCRANLRWRQTHFLSCQWINLGLIHQQTHHKMYIWWKRSKSVLTFAGYGSLRAGISDWTRGNLYSAIETTRSSFISLIWSVFPQASGPDRVESDLCSLSIWKLHLNLATWVIWGECLQRLTTGMVHGQWYVPMCHTLTSVWWSLQNIVSDHQKPKERK